MRIGGENNFLLVMKRASDDVHSPWRVEAVATPSGQRYSAVHDRVMLDTSEKTIQQFAEFEALKTQRVDISLSEGGLAAFGEGCERIYHRPLPCG